MFGRCLETALSSGRFPGSSRGHAGQDAISVLLQVTLETVKTHRKRAYRKLDIASQAELFALMQTTPTAVKYFA